MKLHMDTANDSETQAYVGTLISDATHATLAADATGHYTALAPYVMWPITANLELVTGAYLIRGLVVALLLLGTGLFGAAYAWYRALGLGWVTSVLGLVLLSTSVAFAMQIRGWEIDKLIEPILFLLGAMAARRRQWLWFGLLSLLATANRETGVFLPFLAPLAVPHATDAKRLWPSLACLVVCVAEATWLRHLLPPPPVRAWADLSPDDLVTILGGFCLLPLLSLAGWPAATPSMRWLAWLVAPAWIVFVLATDRLDQGVQLLAPLAVFWLPLSLLALERLEPVARITGGVPTPAAPAARR